VRRAQSRPNRSLSGSCVKFLNLQDHKVGCGEDMKAGSLTNRRQHQKARRIVPCTYRQSRYDLYMRLDKHTDKQHDTTYLSPLFRSLRSRIGDQEHIPALAKSARNAIRSPRHKTVQVNAREMLKAAYLHHSPSYSNLALAQTTFEAPHPCWIYHTTPVRRPGQAACSYCSQSEKEALRVRSWPT
jgi:hypothetical protein